MFTTHEARRRQGTQGRKSSNKNPEEDQRRIVYLAASESPLQDASVMCEDPFDSLPVKSFPGMHELVEYYFDVYPGVLAMTDDLFLKKKDKERNAVGRRSNTVWDIMSSEETPFLVLLAEMSRFLDTANPQAKWRKCHFTLRERALRSIREGLSKTATEPWNISDGYIAAVAGMQGAATIFGEKKAAISHLAGMRELVRLRGGIDTFQGIARRIIIWCEFYVCAAHHLLPTIAPIPPAPSSPVVDDNDDDDTSSPFPAAFRSLVSLTHSRTLARLPQHWHYPGSSPTVFPLVRILHALHLVSTAKSAAWAPDLMPPGPSRDAVTSVLDDAGHSLLVQLALSEDESGIVQVQDEEEDDDEWREIREEGGVRANEAEGENAEDRWLRVVLLHAAHVYLWATLSHIPPGAQMNVLFLERLRRALDLEGGDEGGEEIGSGSRSGGGVSVRAALARCGGEAGEGLMWALAVGWYLADKIWIMAQSGKDQVRMAARGGMMLGWFEDRIAELLEAFGVGEEGGTELAARVVADFPGTDEFRRGWHCLLLQQRFRGLHY
ncbi:uncharacterized protein LTHEOB_3005 [Lasiodiplodia theobromae]|uniref:uncharacterized protein n=1 Tax=Lasiodiplodia theobromae TaxID=45133 RepID=UPI0015C300F2|nr:uncharacterized protein LTHEOB_3005 [Lasiodiplodia theobromae]KAF4535030.1 hypothetical protein LTHEOB_3005 [Lasiodiplodia theobromae]